MEYISIIIIGFQTSFGGYILKDYSLLNRLNIPVMALISIMNWKDMIMDPNQNVFQYHTVKSTLFISVKVHHFGSSIVQYVILAPTEMNHCNFGTKQDKISRGASKNGSTRLITL